MIPGTKRVALRGALLALLLTGTAGFDLLRTDNRSIARGNELMRAGKAKEALAEYDQALKRLPDDPGVRYDRALALAELGQLEEAQKELGRAAESHDAGLKAKAHFNLGNTYARQEKWRDAVEAYKRALAADPRYFDAKWNLELALRKLKEQEEKQKQEEQKKKDEEQKKQDEQKKKQEEQQKQQQAGPDGGTPQPKPEDQQQKDQQQKDQQQKDQQQKDQPKPQPDKGQEQPKPEPQPKAGNAEEQSRPQPQPQANRREAVDTVLDALEKNEKNLPLERLRLRSRRRPDRDW